MNEVALKRIYAGEFRAQLGHWRALALTQVHRGTGSCLRDSCEDGKKKFSDQEKTNEPHDDETMTRTKGTPQRQHRPWRYKCSKRKREWMDLLR